MGNLIKKLFVVLLLALVQTAVCNADSFKGKIVNAETGEILVGATIRSEINPQPGWSIQNSSETDSTGCFILDTSSEGRIMFTFSMIGYKNSRKVDYAYGPEVKDTTDFGVINAAAYGAYAEGGGGDGKGAAHYDVWRHHCV